MCGLCRTNTFTNLLCRWACQAVATHKRPISQLLALFLFFGYILLVKPFEEAKWLIHHMLDVDKSHGKWVGFKWHILNGKYEESHEKLSYTCATVSICRSSGHIITLLQQSSPSIQLQGNTVLCRCFCTAIGCSLNFCLVGMCAYARGLSVICLSWSLLWSIVLQSQHTGLCICRCSQPVLWTRNGVFALGGQQCQRGPRFQALIKRSRSVCLGWVGIWVLSLNAVIDLSAFARVSETAPSTPGWGTFVTHVLVYPKGFTKSFTTKKIWLPLKNKHAPKLQAAFFSNHYDPCQGDLYALHWYNAQYWYNHDPLIYNYLSLSDHNVRGDMPRSPLQFHP